MPTRLAAFLVFFLVLLPFGWLRRVFRTPRMRAARDPHSTCWDLKPGAAARS